MDPRLLRGSGVQEGPWRPALPRKAIQLGNHRSPREQGRRQHVGAEEAGQGGGQDQRASGSAGGERRCVDAWSEATGEHGKVCAYVGAYRKVRKGKLLLVSLLYFSRFCTFDFVLR